MAQRQKVVLAYSGGLDTSVLVRILTDEYGYDVIACHADVGESRDHEKLKAKARQAGAVATEIVDAKEEFATHFCFPALQANALYQGVYPLSAALSRPLIAKHLVAAARKHGATAVAHGATGKGNDQLRFDLAVKGLAPDLKIIAPQRERNIIFFQAEDGIRDGRVTGVQTCALPIFLSTSVRHPSSSGSSTCGTIGRSR